MSAPLFLRPHLTRSRLASLIASLIDVLDVIDGDPDFEADADEDGGDREPSFCGVFFGRGAWDGLDVEQDWEVANDYP